MGTVWHLSALWCNHNTHVYCIHILATIITLFYQANFMGDTFLRLMYSCHYSHTIYSLGNVPHVCYMCDTYVIHMWRFSTNTNCAHGIHICLNTDVEYLQYTWFTHVIYVYTMYLYYISETYALQKFYKCIMFNQRD